MKTKRTEIMIEIDEEIHIAGHRNHSTSAWCVACGSEARMITPEQAAAMARVTVRAVNRRVEAGQVHFLETTDGRLFVCVNSLNLRTTNLGLSNTEDFGGLKFNE